MTRADTFQAEGVRRLYEVMRRVSSSADLDEVLEEIAQGVVEGLGYGVAAISRLEGDMLVMSAVAGNEEVRAEILGRRTPAQRVLGEFAVADHWGILRFVPHDRMPPEQIESLWVPDLAADDSPDAWHPLDALYAPMHSADGELLGNMSVDLPPGNRIPSQQQRELLEMFVVQAGLAMENAQRRAQLNRQLRLGEALRGLAGTWFRGDIGKALEQAARGLAEAMEAAQVTIRCFPDAINDPEEHAAGFPAPAGAPDELVEQLRQDLSRWDDDGSFPFTPENLSAGLPASHETLLGHMRRHGWGAGVLAPVAFRGELLGYLVVLCADAADLNPEGVDAVTQAGRELGRSVRDARARLTEHRLVAELRELDRYKGELIATISHELKTPLTAIMGWAELMDDDESTAEPLAAIRRNAARLDRLVTNLLHYSRLQASHAPAKVRMDLRAVCANSVDLVHRQALTAGVEVSLELPEEPVMVLGDAEELPRVVDNLCSNAVKYTRSGDRVQVRLQIRDGVAEVAVSDTGIGISPQDQLHLFSAFHRSSNPEALTIPGTGLGLAIARTIAELHGGDITLESELGVGSTFTLRVPLAGEDASDRPRARHAPVMPVTGEAIP